MVKSKIKYKTEDGIATVTLSSAPGNNDELSVFYWNLSDTCREIEEAQNIHVVVFTGGEKDAWNFLIPPSRASNIIGERLTDIIDRLDLCTIASINGDAIGQGLELALACDIRIAGKSSRFAMPQILDSRIPWDGGTQRLTRVVGLAKSLELILTGDTINAAEAEKIGLINKISPNEVILKSSQAIARTIAEKGPISLKYVKEAIYKGMDMTLHQGLQLETDLYHLLQTTEDRLTGITAFQKKQRPKFKGK